MKNITVMVAEDHGIVRDGLRALLDHEKDIVVLGEAKNGREAVILARKLRPDVVVMDVAMPLLNGLEATRQILRQRPRPKLLILSMHTDEAYIEQARSLGASGYLSKQTTFPALAEAVRKIQEGGTFFCPAASVQRVSSRANIPAARLTSRETEVLQLVAEGSSNKDIAVELQISLKTVEKHRQSLMDKLDIHHTAGLTRYAISIALIEGTVPLTLL